MSVPVWSAFSATEVTTTSGYPGAAVTPTALTQTLASGKTYAVFWSMNITSDVANATSMARPALTDSWNNGTAQVADRIYGTGGITPCVSAQELVAGSPPDYPLVGGFDIIAGDGFSHSFQLFVASTNSGSGSRAKNAQIVLMELPASALTNVRSSTYSSSTTTFVAGPAITLTGSQDWLVFGCGLAQSTTSIAHRHRLSDAAETQRTTNDMGWRARNVNEAYPRIIQKKFTTTGSFTVSYDVGASGAGSCATTEARILAIPASAFDAVYATALTSSVSGTSTTYTDADATSTLTYTPTSANPHLILAAWNMRGNSNTVSAYTQTLDNGATLQGEHIQEPATATTTFGYDALALGVITPSSGVSRTTKLQRKAETTGQSTGIRVDAAIFVLDLGATGGGSTYTLAAAGASLSLSSPAVSLNVSRVLPAAGRTLGLAGQAVSLRRGYTLAAQGRSLSLSAGVVGLAANRKLVAQARTLTLTGQPVTLSLTRKLAAQGGALSLTAQPVTLTYAPITGRTLTAAAAALSLTAGAVNLVVGRRLSAGGRTMSLAAGDVALKAARKLPASGATLVLAAGAITMRRAKTLTAGGAVLALAAGAVAFKVGRVLQGDGARSPCQRRAWISSGVVRRCGSPSLRRLKPGRRRARGLRRGRRIRPSKSGGRATLPRRPPGRRRRPSRRPGIDPVPLARRARPGGLGRRPSTGLAAIGGPSRPDAALVVLGP